MKIRKYNVSSLSEAKALILRDLGKEAIIVKTSKVKAPGLKGFFGKKNFEVLAALEKKDHSLSYPNKHATSNVQAFQKETHQTIPSEYTEIKKELQENRHLIAKLIKDTKNFSNRQFSGRFEDYYNLLVENGVKEDFAKEIIFELTEQHLNHTDIKSELKKLMLSKVKPIQDNISEFYDSKTIALVGPTGVGKTTSIAKLAANAVVTEGRDVGLITLDTYRIAATEQLKTYGDIIDVPVKVAYNSSQFKEIMQHFADKDNIFVDTAGRSHKNLEQLKEQKSFFDFYNVNITLLVLSLTVNFEQQRKIFESYKSFRPKGVMVTKIDEADFYGNLFNLILEFKLPIYFVTTGQSVPDDISTFSSDEIIAKILEGDYNGSSSKA
ncbi:flagellar biosynthesis protein FlhF [Proteinivorax hydrogeniformans]|uniref:Flagellar biosynthesis protein FlhF n=1 Tax=Proteinivorax hydrogeniformans TaxID=1826727 RepID=A0AAU8HQU2_9FIRM